MNVANTAATRTEAHGYSITVKAPSVTPEGANHLRNIETAVVGVDGKTKVASPERREKQFLALTKELVALTGMPVVGLKDIQYKRTEQQQTGWRTLASMQISGPDKGRLTVTDSVKHAEILAGLSGTIPHELAHNVNPFDEQNLNNPQMYKSPELGRYAADSVVQLADQTRLTGVYLNNYHKRIFEDAAKLRAQGKENEAAALEILETHSIAMEMAVSAPKDLAAKSEAMQKKMANLGLQAKVSAEGVGLLCYSALVGFGNNREDVKEQLAQINKRMDQAIFNHAASLMTDYNMYQITGRTERVQ